MLIENIKGLTTMDIQTRLEKIMDTKILIDELKDSRFTESKFYNVNEKLNPEKILDIIELHPILDIYSKEVLLDENIFTNSILSKFLTIHKTNIRYIDKSRHTLEMYNLLIENEFGLSQLKIPMNLEILNQINIEKISDLFQTMETIKVKEFLNSLYSYNGYAELENSYIFWKNVKNLNELEYKNAIELVNSYKNKDEESLKVLNLLLSQNILIESFFIKLIDFNKDNIKFLTNQFTNKLRDYIEKKYFQTNNSVVSVKDLFKIIPKDYQTPKMIQVATKKDVSLYSETNYKNISEKDFMNVLYTYINLKKEMFSELKTLHISPSQWNQSKIELMEKHEIAIFHLLRNDDFKTKKVFDMIEEVSLDFFIKCAVHIPQEFFTEEQTQKILLENLWDLNYDVLEGNKNNENLLTEDTIKILLTKYDKKTIKNALSDYLPEGVLYLLEIDSIEFYKKKIKEYRYDFFEIPIESQTEELFEYFKEVCIENNQDYNQLIKDNLTLINTDFIQAKNLNDLLFRSNIKLFTSIIEKRPDLLDDLNLNQIMAKKEIFWKFINKSYIDNDKLLFNLLECSKNDIEKITKFFQK